MRVTRQSYGNKLISSVVGAVLGIVLFLGSFIVLYINEGRENMGKVAKDVQEITQSAQGINNGSLVCLKGNLTATTYASDTYLVDGEYIVIKRNVEMYAYVEKKHSTSKDNLGGRTTTTETFTYDLEWTNSPEKPSTYLGDNDEKPTNIPPNYNTWIDAMPSSKESQATGLSIGDYAVNENIAISGSYKLAINSEVVDLSEFSGALTNSDYIYKSNSGTGTPNTPKIGDIRIDYNVVKSDDSGIIMGALDGSSISSFITPKNNKLYRFFAEANSREEAIAILETEHKVMTWILRLVGWLLMFVGLVAMTGPVTKVLSVIPIFSKVTKFLFIVASLFISLILTTITVVLAVILHNFWLAMLFVIALIAIIVLVIRNKHKKALQNPQRASQNPRR